MTAEVLLPQQQSGNERCDNGRGADDEGDVVDIGEANRKILQIEVKRAGKKAQGKHLAFLAATVAKELVGRDEPDAEIGKQKSQDKNLVRIQTIEDENLSVDKSDTPYQDDAKG